MNNEKTDIPNKTKSDPQKRGKKMKGKSTIPLFFEEVK
jgi:hypothetical protein